VSEEQNSGFVEFSINTVQLLTLKKINWLHKLRKIKRKKFTGKNIKIAVLRGFSKN